MLPSISARSLPQELCPACRYHSAPVQKVIAPGTCSVLFLLCPEALRAYLTCLSGCALGALLTLASNPSPPYPRACQDIVTPSPLPPRAGPQATRSSASVQPFALPNRWSGVGLLAAYRPAPFQAPRPAPAPHVAPRLTHQPFGLYDASVVGCASSPLLLFFHLVRARN